MYLRANALSSRMLPQASAPAKLRERASWHYAPPQAMQNSNRLARIGSSTTAPEFFCIPPLPTKTFCSSTVEQNSSGLRRGTHDEWKLLTANYIGKFPYLSVTTATARLKSPTKTLKSPERPCPQKNSKPTAARIALAVVK